MFGSGWRVDSLGWGAAGARWLKAGKPLWKVRATRRDPLFLLRACHPASCELGQSACLTFFTVDSVCEGRTGDGKGGRRRLGMELSIPRPSVGTIPQSHGAVESVCEANVWVPIHFPAVQSGACYLAFLSQFGFLQKHTLRHDSGTSRLGGGSKKPQWRDGR